MFIVSEKNGPHGMLLVVTDTEILGKKFQQGKIQLDLTTEFYKGIKISEHDVKEILKKARYLHLTGQKIITLAVELKIVNPRKILYVCDIPHAEVVIG